MLKLNFSISYLLLLFSTLLLFTQCKSDDNNPENTGTIEIEMTDAPIDDAEVSGAFVTIAEIQLDGKKIDLEQKITIDLLAYQNGDTRSLGMSEIETGAYNSITLVLDHETDASGDTPGCYVLAEDGTKYDLASDGTISESITFNNSAVNISADAATNLVIDFDLRKAIKRKENSDKYAFVANTNLSAALRAVIKAETGNIDGKCENASDYGDRTVVYAYKKGTYSASEMEVQGSGEIDFPNAVTSASLAADGSFALHFLEGGEYEVHFIVYEDTDNDGRTEVKGSLQMSLIGAIGDLLSLNVEANATVNLNVNATGLLPL